MIEFQHKLPARSIDGRKSGTYNNRELGFPSILTTVDPDLGLFLQQLRTNIYADRSLVFIDGKILVTDKNWIRDHVHVMKGMRHWEYDLKSFLNFIIETQPPPTLPNSSLQFTKKAIKKPFLRKNIPSKA